MKKNEVKNKTGFTLIELLIVVLIIGILSATALPMYRKSVEKSRVTDALTTMGAVAKSEHAWYLEHSNYTDDFANLDIELTGTINNGALETDLYTYELLDTGIIAERNNGDYTLYKDYETNQILCTPGTHYICEDLGAFTKVPCEKVGMAWANTNSTCYVNEEARCNGLYPGQNLWNEDTENPENSYCGYRSGKGPLNEGMECRGCGQCCIGITINYGGVCIGRNGAGACDRPIINNGGICKGYWSYGGGNCNSGTVNYGGICEGNSTGNCRSSTVKEGGECHAKANGACNGSTYEGTGATSGCCRGTYCESTAPRCECANHEKMDSNGNCITA